MGYLLQLLIYVGLVVKKRETVERLGLHCLGIKIDALVSVLTYLCNILYLKNYREKLNIRILIREKINLNFSYPIFLF
jgi:hypothetical protein